MSAWRWMSAAACGMALVGCGADTSLDKAFDTGGSVASDSEGGEFDSGVSVTPTWWRLDAELMVSAGQLSASSSELVVWVLGADGEVLCQEPMRIAETDTEPSRPDPSILTWWAIERGDSTGTCPQRYDLTGIPESFHLGVGEMHPELEAVAGQVSDDLPDTGVLTLNGAYARVDDSVDDTWVFGFAGDAAAWSGTSGPATVAPLSDGLWSLKGVYGFPLP